MSAPFLWGSRIDLPAGISNSYGRRSGTAPSWWSARSGRPRKASLSKAWIYDADGSLKEEKVLETPAYGQFPADYLARNSSNPFAVELPDGRIALTWSLAVRSSADSSCHGSESMAAICGRLEILSLLQASLATARARRNLSRLTMLLL